jgi:hypothetical protein
MLVNPAARLPASDSPEVPRCSGQLPRQAIRCSGGIALQPPLLLLPACRRGRSVALGQAPKMLRRSKEAPGCGQVALQQRYIARLLFQAHCTRPRALAANWHS